LQSNVHWTGHEHEWQSRAYVDAWIARDVTSDAERRPVIRAGLAAMPFDADASIRVLDVGGGYGVVTEEVLKGFPHAVVTLQDYSQPMIERARERLSAYAERVTYVLCDLREPRWAEDVGGRFDLAVSALALHNLREMSLIAACYRAIYGLLLPGGIFVNWDYFPAQGVDAHLGALRDAGFERISYAWQRPETASITAYRG
jgi:ubiquinone/menaquinone biosynthesis C-methylase UbiE